MLPANDWPLPIERNLKVAGFGLSSGLILSVVSLRGSPSSIDVHFMDCESVKTVRVVWSPSSTRYAPQNPESEMGKIRDEEFESKSGTENMDAPSAMIKIPTSAPKRSGTIATLSIKSRKWKRNFFKECPHPDDKQRKELSRELGLEPLQVKFWFQNKRTQMKAQHERHENSNLRAENEKLRAENIRYKEALSNATCPHCGGPASIGEMSFDEQHLRIENARLRDEIDRISGIAAKYVGKPMVSYPHLSTHTSSRSLDLGVGNFGAQSGIVGDMYGAMEELIRMAQAGEPLWIPTSDNSTEILSEDEYLRTFPRGIGPKPLGLKSEASRETAVVIMNHISLVEILMDVNQWSSVFSGIVSRAMTLEVLSTGVAGNYNGALQVMTAEFQVPSPLVPTRENYFVRYCKHHPDGTWAVVDVSLDNLRSGPITRNRRRPSGCLIQELPNGYSKVIWVEHVEVDDRAVHNIYRPLVNSGLAFGAKRWVATLDRQCERLASAMASNIPAGDVGVITSPEGRKSMLKLAERMKEMDDPGRPPGIVLSAATSFWIPVPPKRVFDFLRAENSRSEWDILSNGGLVQEMAHIANGRDPGNCVSLLRVNSANSSQSNMLILQESCTDPTGSYVIYAPVDIVAMNVVLSVLHGGGILDVGSGGSLLTVAFQILVDSAPTAKLSLGSVATVNSLIKCTVERIKAAMRIKEGSRRERKKGGGSSWDLEQREEVKNAPCLDPCLVVFVTEAWYLLQKQKQKMHFTTSKGNRFGY
ncbi:Homeobox-leucine zipper protein PROTODERMAL FACTOR 2 [Vitis vinifera]|uniref:Homeobox-leucine zipper protein PROTODERMAL FACTOR 2 n=1 Tax=Vitis vinifera TaxID=29760 RepID=A0A438EDU1_VITVI|nr:Homeobox-leucine zipper protein PROTODERMAL FACTOR 2 [Vitis vinifera]